MESITLYTSRHSDSDYHFYRMFTEQTGIVVNVIADGSDQLIHRLEMEGIGTAADLLMTGDAGNLYVAQEKQLFQSVESERLRRNIPEKLRDSDNKWFGLTKRARVIVFNKERVNPSDLSTYEALTEPEWKGRIRMRSSKNIYNKSLLASFIEIMGEEYAKYWARSIVNNLSREPGGDDFDQVREIAAGLGDVSLINTYYVVKMLYSSDPEDVKAAEAIGVYFPNQGGTGTHVNLSGIALTKYSKNKEAAIRFMEFLSDEAIQTSYAETKYEYPVHPNANLSKLLQSWGDFQEQEIYMDALGRNQQKAIHIFDQAGWQ
ncbi:Fe(3+) ABC transporter substrate-binding protein [Paenibacillus sp. LHD-38]|uniref:Fe(3+) ABC transporter substrate-binding protein n=1 Tax=Paenibacillus sp. LHD-38 TaxID=3072143 RepID=UPI00280F4C74|nr:Fe(3+) ABC transporter substrate-binding protein [Paenibacillus sp. LHD-38]MDQ8736197.1 Fe(3+) ABC transporter substrate-binding protein [Paenibacillus sp. LHD-38]